MQFIDRRLIAPIAYGFSLTFASSIGQTFLLSFFVPSILLATGLTSGILASLYSAATLLAAFLLPVLGRLIDRADLARYGLAIGACTLAGAGLLAFADHAATVFIAYVLLRLFGQGLLPHTAMTGVARFLVKNRGKALAIVSFGYCAGEAVLPLLVAALTDWIGWRWTIGLLGIAVGILIVPFATLLVRQDAQFCSAGADAGAESEAGDIGPQVPIARSIRFWCYFPGLAYPSFAMTALLFLHTFIAQAKGIDPLDFAAGFIAYAMIQIPASILFGALIDRAGSRLALILHVLPMAIGIAVLAAATDVLASWAFLALAGITTGATAVLRTTLVAEFVGRSALGAARSFVASMLTVASAGGAALCGGLIDFGLTIDLLLWSMAGLAAAALVPSLLYQGFAAMHRLKRPKWQRAA